MNRQSLIDILGAAREALDEQRLSDVLTAINAVRDALLDGEPTDSE